MARFAIAGADSYDRSVGRWSRCLVPPFLDFCGPLAGRILDLGCGTGILTEHLLRSAAVSAISGVDIMATRDALLRSRSCVPEASRPCGGRRGSPR